MERPTEAPPEVRPAFPVAVEHDPIADASVAAYSPDTFFSARTAGAVADADNRAAGDNSLDFSTGDIFTSVFNRGERVQVASLHTGDGSPGRENLKLTKETGQRLNGVLDGLQKGDTRLLQQYMRDMSNASDPQKKRELEAGMKELTRYLNEAGIDAKMMMGTLTLRIPGANGNTLSIDKDGRTNLQGNDLRNFGQKLGEKLADKDVPGPLSEDMTDRLDDIENALKRTNLTFLQDAIKEIGNKIHSIKPGAAGAAERKEATELQNMLSVLGSELSRQNVNARYDRHTGSFSITQPGIRGQDETLTIDKYGRANMSGEQLRFFLIRLRDNQQKQPTVPV